MCLSVSAVSMMAAQEYDGMKEQLDLEQSLRDVPSGEAVPQKDYFGYYKAVNQFFIFIF